MADTTNSAGDNLSGTRVKIKGEHNKKIGIVPLSELVPI